MKLYQLPYSHYSAKVKIVLIEKSLDAELPEIPGGSQDSDEYRKVNSTGLVPCLLDNEVTLGESEVIAEYLEEKYPAISMLPDSIPQRAKSRWLSRIHDLQVAPQLTDLYVMSLSTDVEQEHIEKEVNILFDRLDLVEAEIEPAPFFFGQQFCISDASYVLSMWYAIGLAAQFGIPLSVDRYPRLMGWFEHASNRPSAQQVLQDCKVALGIDDEQVRQSA